MTQHAAPARIWDTRDVGAGEAFDYYREGICACFMPLRPELERSARGRFRAHVRSHAMPVGALNIVSARAHQVLRTRAEIAALPEPCYYVNLQLDGICTIEQGDRTTSLRPGEVGLFDSDSRFVLDHGRRPALRVASLMVPKAALEARFGEGPHRLTDDPVHGSLIAEAARALVLGAERDAAIGGLHRVLLSLVSLASSEDARRADPVESHRLRLRAAIRANAGRAGWSLGDCAETLGLSTRQVQRVLADEDDGFAAALTRERLGQAARLLRDPDHAHHSVADIAQRVGYGDPAPFSRAFRKAYGVAPGGWRRGNA